MQTIRLLMPSKASPVIENIGKVFARQIEQRCTAKIVLHDNPQLTVEFAIVADGPPEAFRIENRNTGGVLIIGADERGLLYGAGKFLHSSHYTNDGFIPSSWRGSSSPEKPVRGIYLATHFHNFYHDAPIEKIQHYIEDLGLWGYNVLAVWYDMHHFDGFDDPAAVEFRMRLHAMCTAAKRIGMELAFGVIANEAYNDSPIRLRADPGAKRGGYYDCGVCPSKPGGTDYILRVLGEEFDWFAELKPSYLWIWPYDQGSCGCSQCRPWGGNGFLRLGELISGLARKKLPEIKIIASTWFFDNEEWQELLKSFVSKKPWGDYILAEGTRPPLPNLLPVLGFPEISMHETFPWGGFGATPLTSRAKKQWDAVKDQLAGGFPYSEGIFEDITKVVLSQFYWNDRPTEETLREYIAFEYSPAVVDDILKVIATLEQNHHFRWWPGKLEGVKLDLDWFPSHGMPVKPDPGAEEAYASMKRAESQLTPQARKAWRWRILYLRALLDAELKANGGTPNKSCDQAFAELTEIYHAQMANPVVRPPL